jgi:hypothetical protein
MVAQVGDRIVSKGTPLGDGARVGVITALRHCDRTPPDEVRRLGNGPVGLIFPDRGRISSVPPDRPDPP